MEVAVRVCQIIATIGLAVVAANSSMSHADEAAVHRLRKLLDHPLLLTSDDQSAAKRFSVVAWFRRPAKGDLWAVIERFDSDIGVIALHRDGTPMAVHVNHDNAKFYRGKLRSGWVVRRGPMPRFKLTPESKGPQPEVHLDVAGRLKKLLDAAPVLSCSDDGTLFKLRDPKSDDEITLQVSPDRTEYPIVKFSSIHRGEESGFRIATNSAVEQHWTRKEVTEAINALHDQELAREIEGESVPLLPECPTGPTRALAWEVPIRAEIKVLPRELPEEVLLRVLARGSASLASDSRVLEKFNIERTIHIGDELVRKVTYERQLDNVSLVVRSSTGDPVALLRPGWMFVIVPDRGWVLCDQMYAIGGARADNQWGWKVGKSVSDGGLSVELDPFESVQKRRESTFRFDENGVGLVQKNDNTSIELDIAPDVEEFPLRGSRAQIGLMTDNETFATGESVTPVWTKVTKSWLRSEFKPIEEAFDDATRTAIQHQLLRGQSDVDRAASKRFAEAVRKLSASE